MKGIASIMTHSLPDVDYISEIIGKRPTNICLIADISAEAEAKDLKFRFPLLRIALHPNNNAKMALIAPSTVWISGADFGKAQGINVSLGLHEADVYQKAMEEIFEPAWKESSEL